MASEGSDRPRPSDFGTDENIPPVEEKPYRIVSEANKCFGANRCAEVAGNWEMDLETDLIRAKSYFVGEDELDENVEAAGVCPAKKGRGIIHVVSHRTDGELSPDPHDDGTLPVSW